MILANLMLRLFPKKKPSSSLYQNVLNSPIIDGVDFPNNFDFPKAKIPGLKTEQVEANTPNQMTALLKIQPMKSLPQSRGRIDLKPIYISKAQKTIQKAERKNKKVLTNLPHRQKDVKRKRF